MPMVKQRFLPLFSTPTTDHHTPSGLDQLMVTVYIVCFNDLTHYLSVDCFLKASSHMSILMVMRSGMAMAIFIGVSISGVFIIGVSIIGGVYHR